MTSDASPPDASPSSETIRVRAVVSGLVQGVWYRQSCRREAQRLGVSGWVRNRPDGRVELEAKGARSAVDALLTWARSGPPHAVVESVDVELVASTAPHAAEADGAGAAGRSPRSTGFDVR